MRTTRGPSTRDNAEAPEAKKLRTDHFAAAMDKYDIQRLQELEAGAAEELKEPCLYSVMEEAHDFLKVESNQQRKMLERNPVAYLVKKK